MKPDVERGQRVAAWLGEGTARPNDLRKRVEFFKHNPCPIKTLILLRADGRAALGGVALAELTTVNLDFIRSYRPQTNVVTRPTAGSGRGYSLIGHHELLIPLLAAVLVERDAAK